MSGLASSGMTSPGQLMTLIGFAVLFAFVGYRTSVRYELMRGVTPWHLPSVVWGLICLVLLPIGILVQLVAEFTTRPAPRAEIAAVPAGQFPPPSAPPVLAGPLESTPNRHLPAPDDGSGSSPLFGWYKDVTGRHEQRFWDGRRWSEHVADGGVIAADPL